MFTNSLEDNTSVSAQSKQTLGDRIKSLQECYQQQLLLDRNFEELKSIKEQIKFLSNNIYLTQTRVS